MNRRTSCFVIVGFLLAIPVFSQSKVDLLILNATVYTVDPSFSKKEAIAVKDGKIIAVGSSSQLQKKYAANETYNAAGKFIYPGFIDAHAHFVEYAQMLSQLDLTGTSSWDEIIDRLTPYAKLNPQGWIVGFGWDQNDWKEKAFPSNARMNELFPERPIILTRIDGHAAIVNQKAIELANIKGGQQLTGGEIELKDGQPTGILIDNAIGLVNSKIPAPNPMKLKPGLLKAQENCFAAGLTTIDDCGLSAAAIQFIDNLQQLGELKMRIYAMLSDDPENYKFAFTKGKIKTGRLHVCSFKVYADGALGSRGACLLRPYSDKPDWSGFLLNKLEHYDSVAKILYDHEWQMCTHAIGDSGNRVMLQVYGKYLKGKNDRRWRIEHAQVINSNDFGLFGKYNIIPSIQPTHATSDMYWAGERLGEQRIKGAYAYRELQEQNGWLPLGTDFPVEDISPIKTFYAAVVRKDAKGWPDNGYQMENALSRVSALRGMTIWAAKSNFEEDEKGSIEIGKFADFVILDRDLLQENKEQLLSTQVLRTYVNGELVFEKH